MGKVSAPFTADQVRRLTLFQNSPHVHSFTCYECQSADIESDDFSLVATVRGWICQTCDFVQDWAYDTMLIDDPLIDPLIELSASPKPDYILAAAVYLSTVDQSGITASVKALPSPAPQWIKDALGQLTAALHQGYINSKAAEPESP